MKCHLCIDKKCHTEGKDCSGIEGKPELSREYINAGSIEADYYNKYNRFQELVEYCRLNGYTRIGIAFCIGLASEAEAFCSMLESFGFIIDSVCCKIGGIDKDDAGLKKINKGQYESMCNPYFQAEILNRSKTDLNIIFGLCMGHDIEFSKHSKAPVTTFLVKDRVLGHNPAASVYSKYVQKKIMQDG